MWTIVENRTMNGKTTIHYAWANGDPKCGAKRNIITRLGFDRPTKARVNCGRCLRIARAGDAI